MISDDREQRSRLLALKLQALVRDHTAGDAGEITVFARGAALVTSDAVWVLVEDNPARALGATLAWNTSQPGLSGKRLNIVSGSDADVLARRATYFDSDISVWTIDGRSLIAATPAEHAPFVDVPADIADRFIPMIARCGATPVVEHGVLVGEVRGLEICRVVADQSTGEIKLEVGMGVHDRETFAMVHGQIPTEDALASVVTSVLPHRQRGADPHPFNRFGSERLMRSMCIDDPTLVGGISLVAVESCVPRTNVKDAVPCAAYDGDNTYFSFASGVDLDVVPFAVDSAVRLAQGVQPRVAVVLRERDVLPAVERVARLSKFDTQIITLPNDIG